MKKFSALCILALGLFSQAAQAVPTGWYSLNAQWTAGQFSGKFHYDNGTPHGITAVSGILNDLAQSTAVNQLFFPDPSSEPWVFLANTIPGTDVDGDGSIDVNHNAGFYLTLVDSGNALSLDLAGLNGLYDFSNDALYASGQLDDAALVSYQIGTVPEPGTVLLLAGGLVGMGALRRRRQRRA